MPPIQHMEVLYNLETTGVAMGQKCAPELYDIIMIMFYSLLKKFISLSYKIFKSHRYGDDNCFGMNIG